MSCVFFLAKLQYKNWDTYAGPAQTTPPMRNCLRERYLLRSAYAVASAKVAATISLTLLDVMWSRVQKWSKKNWKMMILWMTCERKAETSSSVEHFVMEDSQTLPLEKLWMGYGPQFDLRAYAFPTRGPTRSLRESPKRKWISENF